MFNNMFIRIYIYIITTGVARQDAHQNRRARARSLARDPLPRANFSPSTLHQTLLSEHNLLLSNDDENGEEREIKREARERGKREIRVVKKNSHLMVSAVFLGILEQTQISSPRPLLSRPSLQVRIRRLFLSVAVFRVRERVHAKRAARWNREESYRSPLVHFSCFNNDRERISKRERSLFDRYALVRGERK
jgi:hypothetical protein